MPVAFDQWYQRRQDDVEGRFFQKIAGQGPRSDFQQTTQGCYIATAGGELLGYNNNYGPDRIRALMKSAIARKRNWSAKPLADSEGDPDFVHEIPEGAIVVQVNSRVLDGYATPRSPQHRIKQLSIGRDNLWILPNEKTSLLRGEFPESLAEKLARFHLIDNTRGEPPMWNEQDVKRLEISVLEDGTLKGRVELQTGDDHRAYSADLYGHMEHRDGQLTRFDIVVKGDHRGHGRWNAGAPEQEFPLVVALRLADKDDVAYDVRPQAIKAYGRHYLHFGRE